MSYFTATARGEFYGVAKKCFWWNYAVAESEIN